MTRISLSFTQSPLRLALVVEEVEAIDTTGVDLTPPQLPEPRPLAKCAPLSAPALRLAGGRHG